jgi:hypothetical protein
VRVGLANQGVTDAIGFAVPLRTGLTAFAVAALYDIAHVALDEHVHAEMFIAATGERGDAYDVARTGVDLRRNVRCDSPAHEADLQGAEVHGNRVGVERVVGLAHQLERRVDSQTGGDILAPFERNADDFGVECGRVANGGVSVDDVFSSFGKCTLDERIALALSGRRRFASAISRGKKTREGVFECALGRR